MSEEQNKSEKEVVPNPEGHTFVICPMEKVFPFVLIVLFIPLVFVRFLDKTWLIPVIWCFGFLVFWIIAHKLSEAKVNIKLSDIGLEQKRLSGSKRVSDYRLVKWTDIRACYSHGSMIRIVTGGDAFTMSLPVFTLFVKQKSNWDCYYAFQNEFEKMARKHNIEIRLGK